METVIESQGLSKQFLLRHNRSGSIKERFLGLIHTSHRERTEEFWALRDVTLVNQFGRSRRNRRDETAPARARFCGWWPVSIVQPKDGLAVRRGSRIGTMIELGIGFHPELTGTENLFLSASVHGLSASPN